MDSADRVKQGDVLWIEPDQCALPELWDGFALRVDAFLGVDGYDERGVNLVWVRGPYHNGRRWCDELAVLVPDDQPLAEPDKAPPSSHAAAPAGGSNDDT